MTDHDKTYSTLVEEIQQLRERIARIEEKRPAEAGPADSSAAEMLRAQRDLAIALGATSDLEQAFTHSLEAIGGISGLDCGGIYLMDDLGGLRLAHHRGISAPFAEQNAYHPPQSLQSGLAIRGEPLYAHAQTGMPDLRESALAEGFRAVAIVPVRQKGRCLGVLSLASRTVDEVPQSARDAIESLAATTAIAIDRILTEAEMRENGRLHAEIVANMSEGVILVRTSDAAIVYANRTFETLMGYGPGELEGLNVAMINAPDGGKTPEEIRSTIIAGLTEHGVWRGEVLNRRRDGTPIWCSVSVTALDSRQHGPIWVGVHNDITGRKEAEAALVKKEEKLRRLLEVQERDRQLIAYEIHDGFTQKAVGAQMLLDAYKHTVSVAAEPAGAPLYRAAELMRQAVSDARALINGLRPPILDEAGLLTAIRQLASQFEGRGPAIHLETAVAERRLSRALESSVFRIVQESLTNAVRHSGAKEIRITLADRQQLLSVRVVDNGRGFDPAAVPGDRFGLEGIRQRAEAFGGRAAVSSAPGRGTEILVELPIAETA